MATKINVENILSAYEKNFGSNDFYLDTSNDGKSCLLCIVGNARTFYKEKIYEQHVKFIEFLQTKYEILHTLLVIKNSTQWYWQYGDLVKYIKQFLPKDMYDNAITAITNKCNEKITGKTFVRWYTDEEIQTPHQFEYEIIKFVNESVVSYDTIAKLRPDVKYKNLIEGIQRDIYPSSTIYYMYDQGFFLNRKLMEYWFCPRNSVEEIEISPKIARYFDIRLYLVKLAVFGPKSVNAVTLTSYSFPYRPLRGIYSYESPTIFGEGFLSQLINNETDELILPPEIPLPLNCKNIGLIIIDCEPFTRRSIYPMWTNNMGKEWDNNCTIIKPKEAEFLGFPYREFHLKLFWLGSIASTVCDSLVHCLDPIACDSLNFDEFVDSTKIIFSDKFVFVPYQHAATYFYIYRYKYFTDLLFSVKYNPSMGIFSNLNPEKYTFLEM
jgi:hypothetical protein